MIIHRWVVNDYEAFEYATAMEELGVTIISIVCSNVGRWHIWGQKQTREIIRTDEGTITYHCQFDPDTIDERVRENRAKEQEKNNG